MIILVIILYILALRGRKGFTDFADFKGKKFAHRGLYGDGIPENSLMGFKNALDNGLGSEFDIHLLKDGELAVIHDYSLKRTTGVDLKVEELTLSEIQKFELEGTDEKIPSFKEVLALYNGKYPLIIELKATNTNVDSLCKATVEALRDYRGVYCIESFDPRCIRWFKKNCPEIIRGQLSENFFKSKDSELPFILKLVLTLLLSNFYNKPDFVAYRFRDRNNLSFKISTRLWGLQGVGWTLKTKAEIETALNENIIPIFEDR